MLETAYVPRKAEEDAIWRRRALSTVLVIISLLGMMVVIGFALTNFAPSNNNPPDPSVASRFLYGASVLHPKPGDRFMFPAITLVLGLLILIITKVCRRYRLDATSISATTLTIFTISMLIMFYNGSYNGLMHLLHGRLGRTTIIIALTMIMLYAIFSSRPVIYRYASVGITVFCSGIFSSMFRYLDLSNVTYEPHFTSHFEAVIYSINKIAKGGSCLIDVLPQYGCYGEFVAPIVRIFADTTASLTETFLVLQLVAITCVLIFATSIIRSPLLIAVTGAYLLIEENINLIISSPDPYYAYNPIRFLFPALSLLAFLWVQSKLSLWRFAILGAFTGLGLAWNLDSGVAVFLSQIPFIVNRPYANPKHFDIVAISRSLSFYIGGTIAAVILFICFLSIKSGHIVDLTAYFVYQKLFYISGFAMLPIPSFPDWWTIPCMLVSVTLLQACLRLRFFAVDESRYFERAAYLAVLAIGLALYYTGRSHWLVLRFVIWPEILLSIFLIDQTWFLQKSRTSRWFLISISCFVLALPFTEVISESSQIKYVYSLLHSSRASSVDVAEDLAFIKSKTHPGESVVILGDNQGTFYGESGTVPAISGPGLAELLRTSDRDMEQNEIISSGPDKLFVQYGALKEYGFDLNSIRRNYALAEWGPDGRLMYLRRKPFIGQDLFSIGKPRADWMGMTPQFSFVQSDAGLLEWGRPSGVNIKFLVDDKPLSQQFTLRMIVKPSITQVDYAALVSSHTSNFRGFAVLHSPGTIDAYFVVIGDSRTFWFSEPFIIPHDQFSIVLINFEERQLSVTVNDRVALNVKKTVEFVPAVIPLTVGDWQNNDRRFSGIIKEVEFFSQGLKNDGRGRLEEKATDHG